MKLLSIPLLFAAVVLSGCNHIHASRSGAVSSSSAEATLLNDAKLISAACMQYIFEKKAERVTVVIEAETGRLVGDLATFDQRVSPGTMSPQNVFTTGGQFTLRHSNAFGGAEVTFNDWGERISQN
jgi:hypothetical protein